MKPPSEYACHLAEAGGLATAGAGLGVMVAPEDDILSCPPGWVFVALERATPGMVQEALEVAGQGRKLWPTK